MTSDNSSSKGLTKQSLSPAKLAFYLPSLNGGGAERCILALAGEAAHRGYTVDLILDQKKGAYLDQIPDGIRIVVLERNSRLRARFLVFRAFPLDIWQVLRPVLFARKPIKNLRALCSLTDYFRREPPQAMVSALFETNLIAIWGRKLAKANTRLIVSQRNTISRNIIENNKVAGKVWRSKYIPGVIRRCYPRADGIVSVSNGVADDLALTCHIDRSSITTIYNPTISDRVFEQAEKKLDHPWFNEKSKPVILAIGRLDPQKDFSTLLKAFALVRSSNQVRLVILGEGNLRSTLSTQAQSLGIAEDVEFVGWVDNPYQYMRNADVFVCSSIFEGLPNALIEAMACGCAVVSTDCPSGPREILAEGAYGRLVPMCDPSSLALAIKESLDTPHDVAQVVERAKEFSVSISADRYLELML